MNHFKATMLEVAQDCLSTHQETCESFACLFRDGHPTQPIPFFGDLESAQIVTVAVNPSSTEFAPWRNWPPELMATNALVGRLTSYFRCTRPRPHPWFAEIEEALNIMDCSFTNNAAHLDLSPRATRAMSGACDREMFLRMVRSEIDHFWRLLAELNAVKIVFLIGGIIRPAPKSSELLSAFLSREHSTRYSVFAPRAVQIPKKRWMPDQVYKGRARLARQLASAS